MKCIELALIMSVTHATEITESDLDHEAASLELCLRHEIREAAAAAAKS